MGNPPALPGDSSGLDFCGSRFLAENGCMSPGHKVRQSIVWLYDLRFPIKTPLDPPLGKGEDFKMISEISPLWQRGVRGDFRVRHLLEKETRGSWSQQIPSFGGVNRPLRGAKRNKPPALPGVT